ncbi:phosphoglycerate kinase [Candidatus Woesebacteria bacterium]|nr:phosphoglycerate kinase [Candidatus Woesebacteria bacterium]
MRLRLPTPADIAHKTVLVRVDFNVPLHHTRRGWQITTDKRLRSSLRTIDYLLKNNAKVVLMSHLGRPKGPKDLNLSLRPIAEYLQKEYQLPITFCESTIGNQASSAVANTPFGAVILLENLRFFHEEKANDVTFAKSLAKLADVYINEAFSASHRAHASIVGVTRYLPSFAGFTLSEEVSNLAKLMEHPKKPFVVVIGGAKISDKVGMLSNLAKQADIVLVGGACANTFLKAEGFEIYRSRVEEVDDANGIDYVQVARRLIKDYKTEHILQDGYLPLPKLIYPIDVIAAPALDTSSRAKIKTIDLMSGMADQDEDEKWLYLDIGPKTRKLYAALLSEAGSVFWNGPMGVWENPLFASGTRAVARAIVQSKAYSVLGGGDTIAAAHHNHTEQRFSYVSAAGGAALEFLSGKLLPGLKPLLRKKT